MAKGLDKQVYIHNVGSEAFYNNTEQIIHKKLLRSYRYRDYLKENQSENITKHKKYIVSRIKKLKMELHTSFNNNKAIRTLRKDSLTDSSPVAIFDSALTRTLKLKRNELTEDIIVVRAFYYKVLENLIYNGFVYNNEEYVYFTSSAGQIRTKKTVFIKKKLWEKYEDSLTCGLTIEEINKKGGCNVNKLLAYKALTASASVQWRDFNIDKSIVVPDLETTVNSLVDYIDRDTYEITRQEMDIPIEHSDGCGMILPRKSKKSFMVRLPWLKGLLVPFSYDVFAEEKGVTKITDIYGKEWDIIKDDIQVIFTKSQFKMAKYYDSWDHYKDNYKKYQCQAAKLNEEDIGEDAMLNYQMLQTLTDISSEELKQISQPTIDDIIKIGSDKETMLRVLGATETNKNKNYFQEALYMYPELLNDEYSKRVIKDKKKKLVKDARSGKLRVNGKYTYVIPDLYAFCERLFLNEVNPKGLLADQEVYCSLYEEGKLDILRSPHLYKEHPIRHNTIDKEKKKWFITKGIYTSVFDSISKILQFDNDGDKVLVIQDDLIIKIAERNMKDVVPLYYEMAVANPQEVNSKNIYDSLTLAFKANIGEVSNNITKVFNSEDVNLDVVKWLCMENNYIIDYAKTLFMPTRPEHIDIEIKKYIKNKVPYFFIDAKDKEKERVEGLNSSTVNRLQKIIPNKNINFEKITGTLDYEVLMNEDVIRTDDEIKKKYRQLDRSKKWIMKKTEDNKSEGRMYIFKLIRDELSKVHNDESRIVDVLVNMLYAESKSSYKTTLWWTYGDILLMNMRKSLKGTKQCEGCGERIESYNTKKYCEVCAVVMKKEQNKLADKKYKERLKKREKSSGLTP